DRSEHLDTPEWFLERRAAAYRAYYEHMPLRRSMVPFGPHMRLHARVAFGRLAQFHLLDDRQYRSPQPCPAPGRGGANVVEGCEARLDPRLTMLGEAQERWLMAGLERASARWLCPDGDHATAAPRRPPHGSERHPAGCRGGHAGHLRGRGRPARRDPRLVRMAEARQ